MQIKGSYGFLKMKNRRKTEQWEVLVSHQSDLLTQDMILTSFYRYNKFRKWGLSFDIPSVRYEQSSGDISYPAWLFDEFRNAELSKEQFVCGQEIPKTVR